MQNGMTAMTCKEYLEQVWGMYQLVTVLANNNGCQTMRLRHKEKQRDIVLHYLEKPVVAYELLCEIHHDHLPTVYDAITLEDGQMVWEEYIDGLTVAEVMQSGRYHYRGAKHIITAVCRALTVLHAQGLVHRDVKPENVMIGSDGRVVLIDFNVSRQVTRQKRDTEILGTVGYASPEQLGISQTDARTDVYAVGVLLNVMLTGKHPSETIARGRIGRVVRKCTNVNPADRYQTADKIIHSL